MCGGDETDNQTLKSRKNMNNLNMYSDVLLHGLLRKFKYRPNSMKTMFHNVTDSYALKP